MRKRSHSAISASTPPLNGYIESIKFHEDTALKGIEASAFPALKELHFPILHSQSVAFLESSLLDRIERLIIGDLDAYEPLPIDELLTLAAAKRRLHELEALSAWFQFRATRASENTFELMFSLREGSRLDADFLLATLERLSRVSAAVVQKFTINAKARERRVAEAAAQHLLRRH
jgi:hypothetical protein